MSCRDCENLFDPKSKNIETIPQLSRSLKNLIRYDGKVEKPLMRTFPDGEGVYTIVVCNRKGLVENACCILVDGRIILSFITLHL